MMMGANNIYLQMKTENSNLQYNLYKAQTNYEVLREWIYTNQVGHPLSNFFEKNNLKKIAVYGMGEIGLLLCNELTQCPEIEIIYTIDKNVKSIPFDFLLSQDYLLDRSIDVLVVTPMFAFNDIKQELSDFCTCKIVSIMEVILFA